MERSRLFILLPLCTLLSLSGCGGFEFDDRDVLYPAGVDGAKFFYEHHAIDGAWGEAPASVWSVDLNTGKSQRLAGPAVRYGLQASGDFYIFTQNQDGESGEIIEPLLGVQISTGETFTIIEDVGLPANSYILDGSRVAFLTSEDNVTVYDLNERKISQVVDIPEDATQLGAFNDDQALIMYWDMPEELLEETEDVLDLGAVEMLLINLTTGAQNLLPETPEGWMPFYPIPQLSDNWIAMAGIQDVFGESENAGTSEVLALHIPTMSWRSLATYELSGIASLFLPFGMVYTHGINDTHVLVYHIEGLGGIKIDLIELETGKRNEIANMGVGGFFSSGGGTPLMHDTKVHWIDPRTKSLVVYDIPSKKQTTIPLGY